MKITHLAIGISGILMTCLLIAVVRLYMAPADSKGMEEPIVVPTADPSWTPPPPPPTMLYPAELKAYERDLKANAKYLQSMRSVFKTSFKKKSSARINNNDNIFVNIVVNRSYRDLARLLNKESEVKIANGDAKGAMDSRIDCLRLSVFASQGGVLNLLSGSAIESMAIYDIKPIFYRLTGEQCLEFEQKIAEIQQYKPSLTNALTSEKATQIRDFRKIYGTAKWKALLSTKPNSVFGTTFNTQQIKELNGLSKRQIESNLIAVYDALIARSKLSYSKAKNKNVSSKLRLTPYSQLVTQQNGSREQSFLLAYDTTQMNLFRAALLKRASNVGTEKSFNFTKRLPLDPFGNGSLKVNSQSIYSVGPDGVDDKGVPITKINAASKGDILALDY